MYLKGICVVLQICVAGVLGKPKGEPETDVPSSLVDDPTKRVKGYQTVPSPFSSTSSAAGTQSLLLAGRLRSSASLNTFYMQLEAPFLLNNITTSDLGENSASCIFSEKLLSINSTDIPCAWCEEGVVLYGSPGGGGSTVIPLPGKAVLVAAVEDMVLVLCEGVIGSGKYVMKMTKVSWGDGWEYETVSKDIDLEGTPVRMVAAHESVVFLFANKMLLYEMHFSWQSLVRTASSVTTFSISFFEFRISGYSYFMGVGLNGVFSILRSNLGSLSIHSTELVITDETRIYPGVGYGVFYLTEFTDNVHNLVRCIFNPRDNTVQVEKRFRMEMAVDRFWVFGSYFVGVSTAGTLEGFEMREYDFTQPTLVLPPPRTPDRDDTFLRKEAGVFAMPLTPEKIVLLSGFHQDDVLYIANVPGSSGDVEDSIPTPPSLYPCTSLTAFSSPFLGGILTLCATEDGHSLLHIFPMSMNITVFEDMQVFSFEEHEANNFTVKAAGIDGRVMVVLLTNETHSLLQYYDQWRATDQEFFPFRTAFNSIALFDKQLVWVSGMDVLVFYITQRSSYTSRTIDIQLDGLLSPGGGVYYWYPAILYNGAYYSGVAGGDGFVVLRISPTDITLDKVYSYKGCGETYSQCAVHGMIFSCAVQTPNVAAPNSTFETSLLQVRISVDGPLTAARIALPSPVVFIFGSGVISENGDMILFSSNFMGQLAGTALSDGMCTTSAPTAVPILPATSAPTTNTPSTEAPLPSSSPENSLSPSNAPNPETDVPEQNGSVDKEVVPEGSGGREGEEGGGGGGGGGAHTGGYVALAAMTCLALCFVAFPALVCVMAVYKKGPFHPNYTPGQYGFWGKGKGKGKGKAGDPVQRVAPVEMNVVAAQEYVVLD